jgi:hypothetical protein
MDVTAGIDSRQASARAIGRRLEWPMLAAALLVLPAIAIEQSTAGQP